MEFKGLENRREENTEGPVEHGGDETTNPVKSPRKGTVGSKQRLAPLNKYLKTMMALSELSNMAPERREDLLRGLYRLAWTKHQLETWAGTERSDALQLRKWSQFLNRAQPRLREALNQLTEIASFAPKMSDIELFFDAKEFRLGIIKSAKRLSEAHELAGRIGPEVAALINPTLRSRAEKKLVKHAFPDRYDFSVRPKSSELDHRLIDATAARMDNYRDDHGKKIPRYDRLISELFKAAFGQIKTDENVRTILRRLRAQNSETNQGREPVGTNSISVPPPATQNVRAKRTK